MKRATPDNTNGVHKRIKINRNPECLNYMKEELVPWALAHGLVLGSGCVCPLSMLPSPVPRNEFLKAKQLGPVFNSLVHTLSKDSQFIFNSLKSVEDEFTQRLVKIYQTVLAEGITQKLALGIHRSDYMLHHPAGSTDYSKDKLLQVEINTISAAFGGLSSKTSDLHRYVVTRFDIDGFTPEHLPEENPSIKKIPAALAKACSLHPNKQAVVLMVVNAGEKNSIDQRLLEHELWQEHKVHLIRKSLTDIGTRATLNPQTKELIIDDYVVGVAYFRSGYTPTDYPTEKEWTARLLLERSTAIKCPNIQYHLLGTKKVQQILANPAVLEKYVTPKDAEFLRTCFAGQYSLDEKDHPEQIIEKVIKDPQSYVMKPQREGGGNLFFGDKMVQALKQFSPSERSGYIIMDRIVPPVRDAWVINKACEAGEIPAVSELGIYGVFIGDDTNTILNEVAGSLVRSKNANDEDGGVVAGVAVLDSVYLV